MLGKHADQDKTEATDPGGKGRLIIPALVVGVAVVVASLVLQGGSPPATEPTAAEPSPAATHGPIVETEPVLLSLSDGSYLKIGVAFQLNGGGEGGEEAEGDEEFASARALDLVVSTYSRYTGAQLIKPRGRAAAKKLMTDRVVAAYGGEVTGLYLTTFVVQ